MITQFISVFGIRLATIFIVFLLFSIFWLVYIFSWMQNWKKFSQSKKLKLIPTTIFVISWLIIITTSFLLIGFYGDEYSNYVGLMIAIWGIFIMIFYGVFILFYQKKSDDTLSLHFGKGMLIFGIIWLLGIIAYAIRWL